MKGCSISDAIWASFMGSFAILGGFSQTWVQVHLRVLKYFASTLVAMLSTSTSIIVENDNVLKYCVKYFKLYLSISEVPKFNNELIIHSRVDNILLIQCINYCSMYMYYCIW